MTLAIVAAMPEELAALQAVMSVDRTEHVAGRTLHHGRLAGCEVVMVLAGIGKVAAAATAALLFERCGARAVLFTGVAGGLGSAVRVGDVVVGTQFLQHDLDASPIFPRWQVPGSGRSHFDADVSMSQTLAEAAADVLAAPHAALSEFGIAAAHLHRGLIVSGDRFVSSVPECARLRADLPEALAVDMESAAMAQVCADFGRPLAVLRCVSDRADDQAHVDFPRFLAQVAAPLARDIVLAALGRGLGRG